MKARDTADSEIKAEIESDDEENRTGQTSFDLAKNNLDVSETKLMHYLNLINLFKFKTRKIKIKKTKILKIFF